MARALVLGGGFGGLAAAHELRRLLPSDDEITLVAARDHFYVGFAKLWDVAGIRSLSEGTRPLQALEQHGIRFVHAEITAVDAAARSVQTSAGSFEADGMVIALGAGQHAAQVGMLSEGAYNLYDAAALPSIRAALGLLSAGPVVVSILGAPYLCPPAPFEAALLLHERLQAQGQGDVEVVVSTPQPMTLPVAGPDASHFLAERLAERGVRVLTEHAVDALHPNAVHFANGESQAFELLLGVPAAVPQPVLAESGVAEPSGWIKPDRGTFATRAERVYAVGDCTAVPTATAQLPKAGAFAAAEGKVAGANLAADLQGGEQLTFDGHGFCFLELPGQQVARVDGNFYAEPKPDVQLTDPSHQAYLDKQRWEQDFLNTWLG